MATVLVVDDNAPNRELIVTLLTYKGHRPLEAADGAEALALARKEHPDLVICDILMPTMDGYEFVRQLRADPKIAHTEVIFYSAYYREQDARNLAKACGVSRVIIKPCVPEEVIETIEQALAHEKPPEAPTLSEDFDREHLRLMTNQLSEKVDLLHSANQRLSALTELNLRLASERDPHALLDQMCRGARDLIGAKYAVLCVREKGDGENVYTTISGIAGKTARGLMRPRIDNEVLGPVITERKARRFTIPAGDARAAGLPSGYPPARSVLACPIASLNTSYGWISLFDRLGADEFSEDDERVLTIHAAQVGRIYENGSLYVEVKRHVELLEESESRLRERDAALLRAQLMAKLAHVTVRPDGSFESWSETMPQLAGLEPAAMPKSTREWIKLIHPDDQAKFRSAAIEAAKTGARVDIEYRLRRSYGSWIDILEVIEPLQGGAGGGGGKRWFGMLQDVTERKRAENRIGRLNRVYAVLSGINALIVRVRDRDELFREACRIAVGAGQLRLAWIGVVDTEAKALKPVAWHGAGEDYFRLMPLGLDETVSETYGLGGRAVTERSAMVANDIASDPRVLLAKEATRRGFGSLAMFPLEVSGSVVALLALYASETGFFDAAEIALLSELAGDIAFALDHIAKEQKLDYLALYDPLTGAPNRTLFRERLAQQVGTATHDQQQLAVVLLDTERLNIINDTLGRQAGDELLKQVATRCLGFTTNAALLARVVGDQFGVIIPDVRSADHVARMIEQKNNEIFGVSFRVDDTELRVSAKFGIAVFPGDGTDADSLLKNAEAALQRAKTTGERYLFYTQQMTERVAEHLTLENKLRGALEKNEFVLHYQPKVDLETRRIVGVEALMRWQSPNLGLVPPLQFIPMLEETGMILDVGAWALLRAAQDHRHWLEQKLVAPRIAVNVSAIQLRHRDFIDVVKDALREGAAPSAVDIEITESVIMGDIATTVDKLRAIRDLGVNIAIDDFGTGYSSLGYLSKLPVHSLKIDRSFIIAMTEDPDTMTLVSTIISLAHSLRLKVCAEGVETEEQAKALRLLRCDEMQGYLISRPVPLEKLTLLLASLNA